MVPRRRISIVIADSLNRRVSLESWCRRVAYASCSRTILRLSESSDEPLKPIIKVSLFREAPPFLAFPRVWTKTEPIAVGIASEGEVSPPTEEATPLKSICGISERVSPCPVDSWRPCADWFPSSSTSSGLLLECRTPELMCLRSRMTLLFSRRLGYCLDHAFSSGRIQSRPSNGFPRLLGGILSLSTQRLRDRKYGPL